MKTMRDRQLQWRGLVVSIMALLAFSAALPSSMAGLSTPPKPEAESNPASVLQVRIGFHVTAIHEVDWRLRNSLVDFYWWMLYPATVPENKREQVESVELVNAALGDGFLRQLSDRREVTTSRGREVYAVYRATARVYFDADFHRYPFDIQSIPISLEHTSMDSTLLKFIDDLGDSVAAQPPGRARTGVASDVKAADLLVLRSRLHLSEHAYETNFGDPEAGKLKFSRAAMIIEVGRPFFGYLVKILIPLSIILLLAYLVFFVPAQNLEVAAGLTVTSLLAAIAFQNSVSENLPEVGYLMTSDRMFHVFYFFIMLAMSQTVITFNLEKAGRRELAERLDSLSKWLFPLTFLLCLTLVLLDGAAGR